ncbi:hypothetical protein [uncultured phage cr6_1]|uniref:Uncharacterized protein n=1 Tax=uncultured phage cr6_1 TaxID=2772085 RepID=A0A7M1RS05_9CAUD|nr:hypothetical protein KNV52_gp68 [uncultured phage cr6_1]QOR57227.1 hypothetical protein [uncultured phage cr6_1]
MNRGRHKKSKEKEFDTQAEILDFIQKKLYRLLAISEDISACSTHDYYAKASISVNDGRNYYEIVAWYINARYYLDRFMSKIRITLNEATIKNSIYTIRFEFGSDSKIFKYKHE